MTTEDSNVGFRGIGVSAGVAVGPVVRVAEPVRPPDAEPAAADIEAAGESIADALERVAADLDRRAEEIGPPSAEILAATALMARDPSLRVGAERQLREGRGPAGALDLAVEEVAASLQSIGGYLAERVTDLRDVRDRAVADLLGMAAPGVPALERPSVLVAHDLAPADTAGLTSDTVLGIVTEAGGPTSHTAILAAQLGIPAVVGAGALPVATGATLALDGRTGEVIVEPDPSTQLRWRHREEGRAAELAAYSGPGQTRDGVPVALLANIGTAADAAAAAEADVEGVGLFRTEFLYLDRTSAPDVAEQTAVYRRVLEAFGDRRVVIRTLDAGADKPLAFADAGAEPNPALGVRGLRLSQHVDALLIDQLSALAAAAEGTGAELWVMAPMVATAAEARWFADRAREAGLRTVGVMIEVPAAALRAGAVLAEVDFASIGTNDLAQYAMAADRMLGSMAALLDPWQPAVLDLIAAACSGADTAAHPAPVGVCGEAAGDPLLALVLVGLGVSSLSMAPARVPAVRAALALHDYPVCVRMAAAAREAADPDAARTAVAGELVPDARWLS